MGAGISDNYLLWKSIDATLALAQSPNTKVVVIGNGKDNVPLFLNGEDIRRPPPPPSDPNPAQVRAETPLGGSVAGPADHMPAAGDKAVVWFRWLARIGPLLTVPASPPQAAPDGAESLLR